MSAIFLAFAAFCMVPISFLYWRILVLFGRNRTAARLAFAFAFLSGLIGLNVAGFSFYKRMESDRPLHVIDLILNDDLETSAILYYGIVATTVSLLFLKTNPHRSRFVFRCASCGNKKALHSPLCIRCGSRLVPRGEAAVARE